MIKSTHEATRVGIGYPDHLMPSQDIYCHDHVSMLGDANLGLMLYFIDSLTTGGFGGNYFSAGGGAHIDLIIKRFSYASKYKLERWINKLLSLDLIYLVPGHTDTFACNREEKIKFDIAYKTS